MRFQGFWRGAALALVMGTAVSAGPRDYAPLMADSHRSEVNRKLDEGRHPAEVLDFTGAKRGQTVADYGAGGGYYSELLAGVVGPAGKVLALLPTPAYKAEVWAPIVAAHPNVVPVVSADLDLAPHSVDMLFAHLEFHDLFLPPRPGRPPRDSGHVIANWFAAVKPGGHAIIIDHAGLAGDVSQIAGKLHRIAPEAAIQAMTAAGFVLEGQSDVLRRSEDNQTLPVFDPSLRGNTDRFMLKFRRP